MTEAVRVVPAAPEHGPLLSALFVRASVACHCRYWHFGGDTNAWLGRCAHAANQNREEFASGLASGSEETNGVVALGPGGERAVGWLKVTNARALPKLYDQRLYRKLPCFDGPREGVLTIGCVLVDPADRRRGVAGALLGGAIALARAQGARALEAFPRRAEALHDADVWTGPFAMYARAGFAVVHDFAPYPVLRLTL